MNAKNSWEGERWAIRHVPPFSIVQLDDGRMGLAPNRANHGLYHVLYFDSENGAAALRPNDEVTVVEMVGTVCVRRLQELREAQEELTVTQ